MSQAKKMIDHLVREKANGNSFQELNIQMKLMLKGIPVKQITESTLDDPDLIQKIHEVAYSFDIDLKKKFTN